MVTRRSLFRVLMAAVTSPTLVMAAVKNSFRLGTNQGTGAGPQEQRAACAPAVWRARFDPVVRYWYVCSEDERGMWGRWGVPDKFAVNEWDSLPPFMRHAIVAELRRMNRTRWPDTGVLGIA